MKLGVFSLSISVKDLQKSKAFYELLGFEQFAGNEEMGYLIMKNERTLIGLFHGMFEGNMLTFNPGWDENCQTVEGYDDVRAIQMHLIENNVEAGDKIPEGSSGPASFMITDPDGNVILLDQHI